MLTVGDEVRLVKGRFAGLKAGETGIVTDVADDGRSFSVNGHAGCLAAYWELVGTYVERRTQEFRRLADEAWKQQAELEALLESMDADDYGPVEFKMLEAA